jgi:protein farnesyltransferase subunit beta
MSPRPCPTDGFPTPTSKIQAETEAVLLKHIPDPNSFELPPTLQKKAHMQYLIRNLIQGFPTRYTSQDASQPWLMFWTLQSFGILQVALDPVTKQKCVFFNFVFKSFGQ